MTDLIKQLGIPGVLIVLGIWLGYTHGVASSNSAGVERLKGQVEVLLFLTPRNEYNAGNTAIDTIRGLFGDEAVALPD